MGPTPKSQADLAGQGFDGVVLATGVLPRQVSIPGIDHPKVLSYVDVLRHNKPVRCLAFAFALPAAAQMPTTQTPNTD